MASCINESILSLLFWVWSIPALAAATPRSRWFTSELSENHTGRKPMTFDSSSTRLVPKNLNKRKLFAG
eukprot:scaffold7035_cov238-Skeletonema_marinoi.AAC.3